LEAADLSIRALSTLPMIEAPYGTVRLEGRSLEAVIPDASATLSSGRKLALKSGRFAIPDVWEDIPSGEIGFKAQGAATTVLDLIEGEPLKVGRIIEGATDVEGKIDGQLSINLPLRRNVAASDLKVDGLVKLTDGRARQLLGSYDAQAATILFNVSDTAV